MKIHHATTRDAASVRALSDKMLGLIRDLDELTGTRKEFLLGVWLDDARQWGTTADEKDRYERDARELITVWTDGDTITDYANRQWNGLLAGFHLHRWEMWLNALNASLARGASLDEAAVRHQIRDWEIAWTHRHDRFPTKPRGDVVEISKGLSAKYSVDASHPIPLQKEQAK